MLPTPADRREGMSSPMVEGKKESEEEGKENKEKEKLRKKKGKLGIKYRQRESEKR